VLGKTQIALGQVGPFGAQLGIAFGTVAGRSASTISLEDAEKRAVQTPGCRA
jgi:hypothetical protein